MNRSESSGSFPARLATRSSHFRDCRLGRASRGLPMQPNRGRFVVALQRIRGRACIAAKQSCPGKQARLKSRLRGLQAPRQTASVQALRDSRFARRLRMDGNPFPLSLRELYGRATPIMIDVRADPVFAPTPVWGVGGRGRDMHNRMTEQRVGSICHRPSIRSHS
jgi:hypothetical protein